MRRLATTDTLLVALSCAVIVLSLWRQGPQRQEFQVTAANGEVRKYSLPLDDPRLRELQALYGEASRHLPPAKLAVARWNRDLADFYCRQTAEIRSGGEELPNQEDAVQEDAVKTVAHQEPITELKDAAVKDAAGAPGLGESINRSSQPASGAHWITVRKQAEQAIAVAQQQQTAPPPVVMGAVLEDHPSAAALVIAIVAGCLLAGGYSLWRRKCPTVVLPTAEESSRHFRIMFAADTTDSIDNSHASSAEHEISIPCHWVRVRQPFAVTARRAGFASVVVCALLLIAF